MTDAPENALEPGDAGSGSNPEPEPQPARQPPQQAAQLPQPPREPRFQDIMASYRGTRAEWLLSRIIGWHERVTPDRQRDIDNILYLLQAIGYIPEDPVTAPFIALIALVWARLPLAVSLDDPQQRFPTATEIETMFRKLVKDTQPSTVVAFDQQLRKTADDLQ